MSDMSLSPSTDKFLRSTMPFGNLERENRKFRALEELDYMTTKARRRIPIKTPRIGMKLTNEKSVRLTGKQKVKLISNPNVGLYSEHER